MVSIPFRFHRLPRMVAFSYMLHAGWRLKRLSSLDYMTRSNKEAVEAWKRVPFRLESLLPVTNGTEIPRFSRVGFLAKADFPICVLVFCAIIFSLDLMDGPGFYMKELDWSAGELASGG